MASNVRPLPEDGPLSDLLVFHNIARALTSSHDRDTVLRSILLEMERLLQPERWALLLLDESAQDLYYLLSEKEDTIQPVKTRVKMGEGMAGWVAQNGETLIIPELGLDPRFYSEAEMHSGGMRSAICVPLRSRSRTLGVIQLFNCRLDLVTEYTMSLLHVLCDYAAIGIENSNSIERIQELTITDDCTGLYNVRHLYATMGREVDRARRFNDQFSLIFIDLDRFKDVNDHHGHLHGSRLLGEVGLRLRLHIRTVDSAYRYGGDEFVVLLPGTRKLEATHVATRLWSAIRSSEYLVNEGLNLRISASFGVATFPEDGQSIHEVISAADEVMYLVKNTHRDSVGVARSKPQFPSE